MVIGASLVYVSGTTLSDAFDVAYDREHNPQRTIPSGVMSIWEVWVLGFLEMALGAYFLFHFSNVQSLLFFFAGQSLPTMLSIKNGSDRFGSWGVAAFSFCWQRLLPPSAYEHDSRGSDGIPGLVYVWSIALLLYIAGITCSTGEATGKLPSASLAIFLLFTPTFRSLTFVSRLENGWFCPSSSPWLGEFGWGFCMPRKRVAHRQRRRHLAGSNHCCGFIGCFPGFPTGWIPSPPGFPTLFVNPKSIFLQLSYMFKCMK